MQELDKKTWLFEAAPVPRAVAQLATQAGVTVNDVDGITIWGNHSATQYPDLFHAEVAGKNAAEAVGDQEWLENTFIPTVAKRGAAIIEARGASSAASAASASSTAGANLAGSISSVGSSSLIGTGPSPSTSHAASRCSLPTHTTGSSE